MPLQIDIVSDHVCPWCYIGKRRMDRALAARPELKVAIRWLPFQLSPDMPREGVDRRAHMERIFGAERARSILDTLADTGREDGIEFRTVEGARAPNTMAAHALMHIAAQTDGIDQHALAEQLFHAHFEACDDIGDIDLLAKLAGAAGLDPRDTRERLASGAEEDAVRRLLESARARGVTGVPLYIFDGRYSLSGAQPPEVLGDVIDRLATPAAR